MTTAPKTTYKLRVSPDGKTVTGLYSDRLPWKALGNLTIRRATDCFFDNDEGKWRILLLDKNQILPEMFESRAEAVAFEIDFLQRGDFP